MKDQKNYDQSGKIDLVDVVDSHKSYQSYIQDKHVLLVGENSHSNSS